MLDDRDALLLNWRRSDYTPLLPFGGRYSSIVYDPVNELWRNFYTTGANAIAQCTSVDGKVWGSHAAVLALGAGGTWDDNYLLTPIVWYEAGESRPWRMLYSGYDDSTLYKIGLATSTDGETWQRKDTDGNDLAAAVLAYTEHLDLGSLMKVGDVYHMFPNTISPPRLVLHYTSTDLLTWTADGDNPIFLATEEEDVDGATVAAARGRFCGDVVRWDAADGTERYVCFMPHYTADSATPAVEVYTCPNPNFHRADRTYIGTAWDSSTAAALWGYAVTMAADVVRIVTDDVTRNVGTSVLTGREVWGVTTINVTTLGYNEALYVHDRTLHGAILESVSADLPVAAPVHALAPAGDASTVALWLPGLTGTLLDLSGNGNHLTQVGSTNFIDALGYNATRASSDVAKRTPASAIAALDAVTGDFTIEWTASLAAAMSNGEYAGALLFWKASTPYHFLLRLACGTGATPYTWSFVGTASGTNRTGTSPAFAWRGTRARWAVAKTGGKLYFFKNGVLLNTGDIAYNYTLDECGAGGQIWLGGTGSGGQYWPGILDEIRISNAARWTTSYTATALSYQHATSGTLFARVDDLENAIARGLLTVDGSTPAGTSLTQLGRVASAVDNQSHDVADFAGYPATHQTGRYQQYAVTLATDDATVTPNVTRMVAQSSTVALNELYASLGTILWSTLMSATYTIVPINQDDGAGRIQVIEGTAGKRTRLRYLCIALDTDGFVQVLSGATALTGPMPVKASTPLIVDLSAPHQQDVAPATPSGGGLDIVTDQQGFGFVAVSQE